MATPPSILATQKADESPAVTTLKQELNFLADNIGLEQEFVGFQRFLKGRFDIHERATS